MASISLKTFVGLRQSSSNTYNSGHVFPVKHLPAQPASRGLRIVAGKFSPKVTGRNLRVAVVGGGPAGGSAAETLAKGGIETFLIERKLDNCKPCGGAIPLCMVGEFDLPLDIIDRRVTKMKMISPSNVAVDIGQTLKPHEYIGMVRREVLDSYLRERASASGATVINGLFLKMDAPKAPPPLTSSTTPATTARPVEWASGARWRWTPSSALTVPTRGWRSSSAPNLAEMYVGDDVSPDFYGWVFPKCDHVAVGTGTVTHKSDIKKFQLATRLRAKEKILGGKIIRVEAHPIPEHPRPRRLAGRVALVGDAAGYVTKCSGEGIYFAAKSGRMCAEAIVEGSENGKRMVDEGDLRKYLEKWDKTYWPTYKVLDVLQKVFYRSNPAREAFVEMCADEYVQKMTFDSYLYKKVVPGNPLEDLKLAVNTIGSLVRANALRREMDKMSLSILDLNQAKSSTSNCKAKSGELEKPVSIMKLAVAWTIMVTTLLGVAMDGYDCKVVQFIFGDSLSDVGNNDRLSKSLAQASLPWYGIDFGNGLPNGRFCNGRTVADIIGDRTGLPRPPAFLDPSLTEDMILENGVNYASGGGGILNETGSLFIQRFSLYKQIGLFQGTQELIKAKIGKEAAENFFQKSRTNKQTTISFNQAGSKMLKELSGTFLMPASNLEMLMIVDAVITNPQKYDSANELIATELIRKFGFLPVNETNAPSPGPAVDAPSPGLAVDAPSPGLAVAPSPEG
ncbi:Geranylgeranyl diphosphate reductase, chloroplastic [Vitis vinifera]|uniref:Geranylgeranyl diphosphate reductase, chloroplastic n=1 Tax=Vitis vinifera TaxID=29760 RepID=A0A438I1B1_VITVI|nr:Geranylgeranyl diphosphate reductase, chloroplastic [Vitis vinifera]